MIHENATINFKLGFFSKADMREYDELCLKANSALGTRQAPSVLP